MLKNFTHALFFARTRWGYCLGRSWTRIGLCALFLCSPFPVLGVDTPYAHAHEHQHKPEETAHYHFPTPTSLSAALSSLKAQKSAFLTLEKGKKWTSAEFEEMHKASYLLEANLTFLRSVPSSSAKRADLLDRFDEAIQTVHYGSEQENLETVTSTIPRIISIIDEVVHAF